MIIINNLIDEILPNMKEKMKMLLKEHKKAVEKINEYNKGRTKEQNISTDIITDIDGMNELNKDFNPLGLECETMSSSNAINARHESSNSTTRRW